MPRIRSLSVSSAARCRASPRPRGGLKVHCSSAELRAHFESTRAPRPRPTRTMLRLVPPQSRSESGESFGGRGRRIAELPPGAARRRAQQSDSEELDGDATAEKSPLPFNERRYSRRLQAMGESADPIELSPLARSISFATTTDQVPVSVGPRFLELFSENLYSSPTEAFEELVSSHGPRARGVSMCSCRKTSPRPNRRYGCWTTENRWTCRGSSISGA